MLSRAFALLVLPVAAMAQLASMRATLPGSLHQCEDTNLFFFDTDNSRPLTVLFLPSGSLPASLSSGTCTIEDAVQYNPLQVIEGYNAADAAAFDFTLQIAEGQAFEVFGFLSDGTGKALSLTRTVTTPLPAASSCLSNIQTTVSGINAAAAATTPAASSSSSSASSASLPKSSAAAATASSTASHSSSSSHSTSTTTATATASPTSTSVSNPAAISSIPASKSAASSSKAIPAMTLLFISIAALACL